MPHFGTNAFAAPGLGLIGGLIMLCGGVWWLNTRVRNAVAKGEGYGEHDDEQTAEGRSVAAVASASSAGPSFAAAIAPIIIVIAGNYAFSHFLIPQWDTSFLADSKYGAAELKSVLGIWAQEPITFLCSWENFLKTNG